MKSISAVRYYHNRKCGGKLLMHIPPFIPVLPYHIHYMAEGEGRGRPHYTDQFTVYIVL